MQFPDVAVMNMVMIYNTENDSVLMQHRTKKWTGGAFPGGHIEKGESIYDSCVREVYEETGLTITGLTPCGIVHWDKKSGNQEFIFLYRTCNFSGELSQCDEGVNEWIPASSIASQELADWFRNQAPIFFANHYTELSYIYDVEAQRYIQKFILPDTVPDINNLPSLSQLVQFPI